MSQRKIIFQDLEIVPYGKAWEYQEQLFQDLLSNKINQKYPSKLNYLLFCEHPHVFTIGKNGKNSNLLVHPQNLAEKKIDFFQTNRGGDITYHGYGQLVGYPILDLENFGIGLRQYIFNIEETIIQFLKIYALNGERIAGAAGVWLKNPDRKICAIGVKSSKMITMHGFALNILTDLSYFNYIHPCGFTDKGVTSLALELGIEAVDFQVAKQQLKTKFQEVFAVEELVEEKPSF